MTFKMPARNITLKLEFAPIVTKPSLTIDLGKGDKTTSYYSAGINIDCSADEIPGKIFKIWEVVSGNVTILDPKEKKHLFICHLMMWK